MANHIFFKQPFGKMLLGHLFKASRASKSKLDAWDDCIFTHQFTIEINHSCIGKKTYTGPSWDMAIISVKHAHLDLNCGSRFFPVTFLDLHLGDQFR